MDKDLFVYASPTWQGVYAEYSKSYCVSHRSPPSKEKWAQTWAVPLTTGVTLDRSRNFSELQFLPLTGPLKDKNISLERVELMHISILLKLKLHVDYY